MAETGFRIKFYSKRVVKQFDTLPKSAREMVQKAIKERLEVDPVRYGKPLSGSRHGDRRLRTSIYRIIYRVDNEENLVTIIDVDYRRDIYDN